MRRRSWLPIAGVVLMAVCTVEAGELKCGGPPNLSDRLIVHEWGTFTELQDEQAISLGGVNVDDEPVPDFVHGFGTTVLRSSTLPSFFMKGLPRGLPQVAMRLETPVLYFYPPAQAVRPIKVDIEVAFHGGWLSEFYPRADFDAPGLKELVLTPSSVGRLRWQDVTIGGDAQTVPPETASAVWLTPRKTDAALVTTPEGETEHYLFYRGVGNFPGPLRVSTDRVTEQLTIRTDLLSPASTEIAIEFPGAWLVHVRPDQSVAYRRLDGFTASTGSGTDAPIVVSSRFDDEEFTVTNLANLKAEMHDLLTRQGLFPKEATAMLETWHHAYFQSPGLRLFYLVPEVLINQRMPLQLSVDADVSRVMIGRVELISARQRQIIEEIKRTEVPSSDWVWEIPASEARNRFLAGRSDFGDLGVEIPSEFQRYLELGRFRNALIRAEHRLRPTPELNQFVTQYRLQSNIASLNEQPTVQEELADGP